MKKIKWVLIAIWILTNSMTVYADTPDYILGREMSESEILKQQQYEPDRDTYISEGELKAVPVADNGLSRAVSLPSAYDARKEGVKTEVKNQDYQSKSYGTCWSFATCAVGENYLVKKNILSNADLSEMHLTYYAYHRAADPLGGTKGDYVSSNSTDYRLLGGNGSLSVSTLAQWIGPVSEEKMQYENIASSDFKPSEAMAYGDTIAHLQNSYWVSMEDTDTIKTFIKNYGSVQISFRYLSSCYNYSTAAYYKNTTVKNGTNHAICIVGWDDDYNADNFKTRPSGNGAWLAKNSWGPGWGDNGYFWISYDDVYTSSAMAYTFIYESNDNYDNNYQYDGTANLMHYTNYGTNDGWMANVFTADSDEVLKAVSFYTLNPSVNYQIQIYKGLDENSPISDSPCYVQPQEGSCEYMGYHTIQLSKTVYIDKGEKYSVVIKLNHENESVYIPTEATEQVGFLVTAYSEPGQSFIGYDGETWFDREDNGNVRIKAFTDRVNLSYIQGIEVSLDNEGCVHVSWHDNEIYDGYTIYRFSDKGSDIETVANMPVGIDNITDKEVESGISYHYTVKGYIEAGGKKYYGETSYYRGISIPIANTVITTKKAGKKSIKLKWEKAEGISGYLIYRSETEDGKYSLYRNITTADTTTWSDKNANKKKNYHYKIKTYKFAYGKVIYGDESEAA